MKLTQEEVKQRLSGLTREMVLQEFNEKCVDPDYKSSEWYEVNQYYSHMVPRPYSARDMKEKVFIKDLTTPPAD